MSDSKIQAPTLYPVDARWAADLLGKSSAEVLAEAVALRRAMRLIHARTFTPGSAKAAACALDMWRISDAALNGANHG